MIERNSLVWNILTVDYRNKVAVLKEEIESLQGKVRYFTSTDTEPNKSLNLNISSDPPGKEIFHNLGRSLNQLSKRIEKYSVDGEQGPWEPMESNTAMALANYRNAMDNLGELLSYLTVIEERLIQQMEARPLYFPAPRIFRRRHEEFQMYLNDQLINKQQKLVARVLAALFPKQEISPNITYQVLSSTEFIPDTQIIRDKVRQGTGGEKAGNGQRIFHTTHPYWFQSFPIMLPETAHEHIHIFLLSGEKHSKNLIETNFSELIGDIGLLYKLVPPRLGVQSQPLDFASVMIEEVIADVCATMLFGEAYLLPLFLQLVGIPEFIAITERKAPNITPFLPWWGRLKAVIEILYNPSIPEGFSDKSVAGSIHQLIEDYLPSRIQHLPADQSFPCVETHDFQNTLVSMIVAWLRPRAEDAFKRLDTKYPLSAIEWIISPGANNDATLEIRTSRNTPLTAFRSYRGNSGYSLWKRLFPEQKRLPSFGEELELFINAALPEDGNWGEHGRPFQASIPEKGESIWQYELDKSVPLEYFIWAGYMASLIGMEKKTKTIMGSYGQLLARGFISGLEHAIVGGSPSIENIKPIPFKTAAHRSRRLSFVKWRMEKCLPDSTFNEIKEQLVRKDPWSWDQDDEYRFWTPGPFSVVLGSKQGFSRRSSFLTQNDSASSLRDPLETLIIQKGIGVFGEELVICPWYEYIDAQTNSPNANHESWHLIVQVRIKTEETFWAKRDKKIHNAKGSKDNAKDPVCMLLEQLHENSLLHPGDAIFSTLSWSHIIFILAPRTLEEAFLFKDFLQGLGQIDRTQTTFTKLIKQEPSSHRNNQHTKSFIFRSSLRLDNINVSSYKTLIDKLKNCSYLSLVEKVPGMFDLQVTWNKEPDFYGLKNLYDLGVISSSAEGIPNKKQYIISDIQTTVTNIIP